MTADQQRPPMCEDCRKLVDAGPSTPSHDNLVKYRSRQMSNAPAPTDERDYIGYICNVCRQDWRLETRGRGWIAC
jgi:hypothetical protein